MDEVSERDLAIYVVGFLAGCADREMSAVLARLVPPIRCPFGEHCACDPDDPKWLMN